VPLPPAGRSNAAICRAAIAAAHSRTLMPVLYRSPCNAASLCNVLLRRARGTGCAGPDFAGRRVAQGMQGLSQATHEVRDQTLRER
jgi:hypothetical protein